MQKINTNMVPSSNVDKITNLNIFASVQTVDMSAIIYLSVAKPARKSGERWSRCRALDCQSKGRWFNPTYRRFKT